MDLIEPSPERSPIDVARLLESASSLLNINLPRSTMPLESKLYLVATCDNRPMQELAVSAMRDRGGSSLLMNLFDSSSASAKVLALNAIGQLALAEDRHAQTDIFCLRGLINSSHPGLARTEVVRSREFETLFGAHAHEMPALVAYLADGNSCSQLNAMCDRHQDMPAQIMRQAALSSGPTRCALLSAVASSKYASYQNSAMHELSAEGRPGLEALFKIARESGAKAECAESVIIKHLRDRPQDSSAAAQIDIYRHDAKFTGQIISVLADNGQAVVLDGLMRNSDQPLYARRLAAQALIQMPQSQYLSVGQDQRMQLVGSLTYLAQSYDFGEEMSAKAALALGNGGLPPETAARAALTILKSQTGALKETLQSAARLVPGLGYSSPLANEIVNFLCDSRRSFGQESSAAASALGMLGSYGKMLSKWHFIKKYADLVRDAWNDLTGNPSVA